MGGSVSGSRDSSAAGWAEATLGAAEAYADEQANAAAEARQSQEQAGTAPADGVEPTPEQRAQDSFWNHDPNRPAPPPTTGSTPESSTDTRVAVSLSPEEAKAFADAGMKVTSDGKGGYFLDAPADTVSIVETTPPQAPPDMGWLPGYSSSSPIGTSPPPPASDNVPAQEPTPEASPAETAKTEPKAAPKIERHPVKDIDKLESLDPAFRAKAEQLIEKMQDKGYKMRVVWAKRTQEENDALVERGTASPTSKHLDGQAIDLINRLDPYPDDPETPYYKDLEATAKEVGLVWGGDFKSRWDPTHIEMKP